MALAINNNELFWGPAWCQARAAGSRGAFCLGEPVVLGQGQACPAASRGCFLSPRNPIPPQVLSWKSKLPLQTIMRLLQVLVPQVEKICIDK